jgi:hypothetical protein
LVEIEDERALGRVYVRCCAGAVKQSLYAESSKRNLELRENIIEDCKIKNKTM